ncbi:MAG: hypothetical protein V1870_01590 [Candidatus Aenigmatarchaeota archaeon]
MEQEMVYRIDIFTDGKHSAYLESTDPDLIKRQFDNYLPLLVGKIEREEILLPCYHIVDDFKTETVNGIPINVSKLLEDLKKEDKPFTFRYDGVNYRIKKELNDLREELLLKIYGRK